MKSPIVLVTLLATLVAILFPVLTIITTLEAQSQIVDAGPDQTVTPTQSGVGHV